MICNTSVCISTDTVETFFFCSHKYYLIPICCLSTVYKKGQRGKKEVSEQKRKDKEKKVDSENDKSREEEDEEEERMEEDAEAENEADDEEVEN